MSGKIIEIAGPSGVGKSTFLKGVYPLLPEHFITKEQAGASLEPRINEYLKNGIRTDGLVKTFISKKQKNLLNNENYNKNFFDQHITFFMKELIFIDNLPYIPHGKIAVLDEGIIHNFSKQVLETNNLTLLNLLFSNLHIIYLDAPNHWILSNLKQRAIEQSGAGNDWFAHYNGDISKIILKIESGRKSHHKAIKLAQKFGVKVLYLNVEGDKASNVEKALDFITSDKNSFTIDIDEFYDFTSSKKDGHWDYHPLIKRWDYHKEAINIINEIGISSPDQVLEIGTVGLQLVQGGHTLDQDKYWNYPGKNPTYNHDARNIPWPLAKKYKIIIALRVFQYLVPYQEQVFAEVKRLCEHLILVVPRGEAYRPNGLEESHGITMQQFLEWNNGAPPTVFKKTMLGDFYYWNFKDC